jgi:hypothetical protein
MIIAGYSSDAIGSSGVRDNLIVFKPPIAPGLAAVRRRAPVSDRAALLAVAGMSARK